MKILFLHLSDAHFREDTKFDEINIKAMVNALRQIDRFDECAIVFSGDIVHSGGVNQYKIASRFIGKLINQLKTVYLHNKKIYTFIVPGNHDNLVANPDRGIEELKSYYFSPKMTDGKFYKELSQLNNFYDFARRNHCFQKEKIVEVKK